MTECIVCGEPVGFWSGDEYRRCRSCTQERKWPEGHPNYVEQDGVTKVASQDQPNGSQSAFKGTKATTNFTSIAWFIVVLTLVSTPFAGLLIYDVSGQLVTAIIISLIGFVGAIFLGLLAEISSNIARLVNKQK